MGDYKHNHGIFFQKEDGFTFIEVMMAVCVLAFGVIGVSVMQTTAISANNTAMRLTSAVAETTNIMERLLNETYDTVAGGSKAGDSYSINWVVTNDAASNTKTVNAVITYYDNGNSRTLELDVVRGQKVIQAPVEIPTTP